MFDHTPLWREKIMTVMMLIYLKVCQTLQKANALSTTIRTRPL
jgi:hypothetical protein